MTWVRYYSKKFLGPYLGNLSVEKANRYMNITRIVYFFSASSLALFLYIRSPGVEDGNETFEAGLSGEPVIVDESPAHKTLREKNIDHGFIYNYHKDTGLTRTEYSRALYMQELERDAFKRAKEAQEKALAEGKELPPDAIKLV